MIYRVEFTTAIVYGPSRMELFDALEYAYRKPDPSYVTFKIGFTKHRLSPSHPCFEAAKNVAKEMTSETGTMNLRALITGLDSIESVNAYHWIRIEGRLCRHRQKLAFDEAYTGHFDVDARGGWLKFFVDFADDK